MTRTFGPRWKPVRSATCSPYPAHQVVTPAGRFQAKALVTRIPKRAWQQMSAGAGAKGERYYDWAQLDIAGPAGRPGNWWLLIRRNRRSGELAFDRCFSHRPVPLTCLVPHQATLA